MAYDVSVEDFLRTVEMVQANKNPQGVPGGEASGKPQRASLSARFRGVATLAQEILLAHVQQAGIPYGHDDASHKQSAVANYYLAATCWEIACEMQGFAEKVYGRMQEEEGEGTKGVAGVDLGDHEGETA